MIILKILQHPIHSVTYFDTYMYKLQHIVINPIPVTKNIHTSQYTLEIFQNPPDLKTHMDNKLLHLSFT